MVNSVVARKLLVSLQHAVKSDRGLVRETNEDAFSIAKAEKSRLYLVADGMGGPSRGEIASHLALSTIETAIKGEPVATKEVIREAINKANASIRELASSGPHFAGMGTTLSGIVFSDEGSFLINIGNSRVYRIRDGEMVRLTTDHTLEEEFSGEDDFQDDATGSSHMLTRSLGNDEVVEVDIFDLTEEPQEGDYYVICTDGLFDVVKRTEIVDAVADRPLKEVPKHLGQLARERGGRDNCTCLLVRVSSDGGGGEEKESSHRAREHHSAPVVSSVDNRGADRALGVNEAPSGGGEESTQQEGVGGEGAPQESGAAGEEPKKKKRKRRRRRKKKKNGSIEDQQLQQLAEDQKEEPKVEDARSEQQQQTDKAPRDKEAKGKPTEGEVASTTLAAGASSQLVSSAASEPSERNAQPEAQKGVSEIDPKEQDGRQLKDNPEGREEKKELHKFEGEEGDRSWQREGDSEESGVGKENTQAESSAPEVPPHKANLSLVDGGGVREDREDEKSQERPTEALQPEEESPFGEAWPAGDELDELDELLQKSGSANSSSFLGGKRGSRLLATLVVGFLFGALLEIAFNAFGPSEEPASVARVASLPSSKEVSGFTKNDSPREEGTQEVMNSSAGPASSKEKVPAEPLAETEKKQNVPKTRQIIVVARETVEEPVASSRVGLRPASLPSDPLPEFEHHITDSFVSEVKELPNPRARKLMVEVVGAIKETVSESDDRLERLAAEQAKTNALLSRLIDHLDRLEVREVPVE